MLNMACRRFREAFEPGRPDGHAAACDACRIWAREVESLRTLGTHVPLPAGLHDRLKMLGGQGAGAPFIAGPLPQIPLPSDLMARLYRIPSESRLVRPRRPVAARSGEMIAASLFFATLLTLGLGNSLSPVDHPNFTAASRIAGVVLKEAGNRGTQTLLGVGQSIFDGCFSANRSLEKLLDRLGEPRRETTANPRTPEAGPDAAPSQPPSTHGKENPHGSRQTH